MLNLAADTAPDDVTSLSIHEVAPLVKQKKISPVEITRACLARTEALNPLLNAFITVTAESALAEARRAESEVQRGQWRGPLHGIPKPSSVETELCAAQLKKQAQMYVEVNAPPEQASRDALTSLGQMLMSSNEFLCVEENL